MFDCTCIHGDTREIIVFTDVLVTSFRVYLLNSDTNWVPSFRSGPVPVGTYPGCTGRRGRGGTGLPSQDLASGVQFVPVWIRLVGVSEGVQVTGSSSCPGPSFRKLRVVSECRRWYQVNRMVRQSTIQGRIEMSSFSIQGKVPFLIKVTKIPGKKDCILTCYFYI